MHMNEIVSEHDTWHCFKQELKASFKNGFVALFRCQKLIKQRRSVFVKIYLYFFYQF